MRSMAFAVKHNSIKKVHLGVRIIASLTVAIFALTSTVSPSDVALLNSPLPKTDHSLNPRMGANAPAFRAELRKIRDGLLGVSKDDSALLEPSLAHSRSELRARRAKSGLVKTIREVHVDDYLVHRDHGIGQVVSREPDINPSKIGVEFIDPQGYRKSYQFSRKASFDVLDLFRFATPEEIDYFNRVTTKKISFTRTQHEVSLLSTELSTEAPDGRDVTKIKELLRRSLRIITKLGYEKLISSWQFIHKVDEDTVLKVNINFLPFEGSFKYGFVFQIEHGDGDRTDDYTGTFSVVSKNAPKGEAATVHNTYPLHLPTLAVRAELRSDETETQEPQVLERVLEMGESVEAVLGSVTFESAEPFVFRVVPRTRKQATDLRGLDLEPLMTYEDIKPKLKDLLLSGQVKDIRTLDDGKTIQITWEIPQSFGTKETFKIIHLTTGQEDLMISQLNKKTRALIEDPKHRTDVPHVESFMGNVGTKLLLIEQPFTIPTDAWKEMLIELFEWPTDMPLISESAYAKIMEQVQAKRQAEEVRAAALVRKKAADERAAADEARRQRRDVRYALQAEVSANYAYRTIVSLGDSTDSTEIARMWREDLLARTVGTKSFSYWIETYDDYLKRDFKPADHVQIETDLLLVELMDDAKRFAIMVRKLLAEHGVQRNQTIQLIRQELPSAFRRTAKLVAVEGQPIEGMDQAPDPVHYALVVLGEHPIIVPPRRSLAFTHSPSSRLKQRADRTTLEFYVSWLDFPFAQAIEVMRGIDADRTVEWNPKLIAHLQKLIASESLVMAVNGRRYRLKSDRVEILDADHELHIVSYDKKLQDFLLSLLQEPFFTALTLYLNRRDEDGEFVVAKIMAQMGPRFEKLVMLRQVTFFDDRVEVKIGDHKNVFRLRPRSWLARNVWSGIDDMFGRKRVEVESNAEAGIVDMQKMIAEAAVQFAYWDALYIKWGGTDRPVHFLASIEHVLMNLDEIRGEVPSSAPTTKRAELRRNQRLADSGWRIGNTWDKLNAERSTLEAKDRSELRGFNLSDKFTPREQMDIKLVLADLSREDIPHDKIQKFADRRLRVEKEKKYSFFYFPIQVNETALLIAFVWIRLPSAIWSIVRWGWRSFSPRVPSDSTAPANCSAAPVAP